MTKEEIVDRLVDLYTDSQIPVTAAGGIFAFTYGEHVDGVYKPTELMNAAHEKDPRVKTRYEAELGSALNMYRYFKAHPEKFVCATASSKRKSIDGGTIPRQLITYGAPGTGKSFRTKVETEGKDTFRTTFHPDSDYSTFVGAYKPTMRTMPRVAMINDGKDAVKAGGDEELKTVEEIAYDFIPQAFVKAYVAAWQKWADAQVEEEGGDGEGKADPVFLVIEEINRGNCAQIFGDLFQLLDRNDAGYSDYPIEADADLARWLKKQFGGGLGETALPADVASGKKLMLPPNLYIRATMNTSDQSLFPIDSAFKRRWDWEYVPIKDEGKGWYVKVGADKYKWWSFLEKINGIVYEETSSADKQMGYFFVKLPEGQKEIDLKKFVNKVAFYLWNDVFKDCEIREDALKLKDANGRPGEPIKFTDFFKPHSNELNEQVVKDLFEGLGVEKLTVEGSEGA